MQSQTEDPGLGEKYLDKATRLINQDGSFNIIRTGGGFHYKDSYQFLINLSWPKFLLLIVAFYFSLNIIFSLLYSMVGLNHLRGLHSGSVMDSWSDAFFFSVQTFTTVGYGGILPEGISANLIAAIEAMTGLLSFAIITGLLYGRFSRPSSRILYSRNMLIAPHEGKRSIQFRIANQRRNVLMELQATILYSHIDYSTPEPKRKYFDLRLERDSVYFFPLNWTIVHIIDENSPLYNKSLEDIRAINAEFLILIKGFDDTFSQQVHSRYSYRAEEIIEGARFTKAYSSDDQGIVLFPIQNIHNFEKTDVPQS